MRGKGDLHRATGTTSLKKIARQYRQGRLPLSSCHAGEPHFRPRPPARDRYPRAMPPSREEDLDWLYGRAPRRSEPEPTRVLPGPPDGAREASRPQPRTERPPASDPVTPDYRDSLYRQHHPDPAAAGTGPDSRGQQGPPPALPPQAPPMAPPSRPARRRRPVRTAFRVLALLLGLAVLWLVGVP